MKRTAKSLLEYPIGLREGLGGFCFFSQDASNFKMNMFKAKNVSFFVHHKQMVYRDHGGALIRGGAFNRDNVVCRIHTGCVHNFLFFI